MASMMNVSVRREIFNPSRVRESLTRSNWAFQNKRRSYTTGGKYEIWVHKNQNGDTGYATIPVGEDYIAQFAQETLASIAKHYDLPQAYIYEKLFYGEPI